MKHPILFLLAAAMIVACKPQQNASAQQPLTPIPSPKSNAQNLVRLETGGCRGYCPVYKLTFQNDGTLEYVGSRDVEKVGTETVKLSADEFSRLQNEVRRVNLWQYPAVIQSTVVDAPAHTFTVFEGAKIYSVKGTAGIPKPIMALEKLMQDIAEAHGIQVKKGVDPNDPAALKGEVIVHFKSEVNAGNFCMQFMEMKVRPVRRISEENIWIIGFNPSELTEEQFLNILDGMEGVIKAQSNKAVNDRN